MPENNRCHECQQLWGEYTSAALEQVRLDRRLYFATIGHEAGSISNLKTALDAAVIARDAIRELIRIHQQSHQKADATSA